MNVNSAEIVQGAEAALRKRARRRRWISLVIVLALLVSVGTVAALRIRAVAMNHKKTVMACTCQVHQHTDDCYDEYGNLICGYADYVVHTHDANCYDDDGDLICTLPEIEEHTHTAECYGESRVPVCGLEESAGHVHDDSCYTLERGDLICGYEEHTHTDACYDEEGNLVCGYEEHVHTDDCYAWNSVLTCGLEEGEGAHTHTDACYETQYTLICDKPEVILHTHVPYDPDHPDADACYDEYGNLICGMLQVEAHQHTADCLQQIDMTEEEVAALNEEENSDYVFVTTEDDETEEASEEPASDELSSAEPAQEESITRTYEDDIVIVTVTYTAEANIPDTAELRVTHYDADSEEYQNAQAETGMNYAYLFDVGFWVDDEEIEPAAPVEMTIDVKGDDTDYSVTHFAESGTEMVDSEVTADGEIVCELDSFSLIGLGTSADPYIVEAGKAITITPSTSSSNDTYNNAWTSSNTGIATVSGSATTAVVTGVSAGGPIVITHTWYTRSWTPSFWVWGGGSWTYTSHTEYFYVTVTAAGTNTEEMVYVAVYATDGYPQDPTVDTSDLQELLGLPYKQTDGYYPVGVVQLPKSIFTSTGVSNNYIRNEDTLSKVISAIANISTDELVGQALANVDNTVRENLAYAQNDIYTGAESPYKPGSNIATGTAGSLTTAMFNWNQPEYASDINRFNTTTQKSTESGINSVWYYGWDYVNDSYKYVTGTNWRGQTYTYIDTQNYKYYNYISIKYHENGTLSNTTLYCTTSTSTTGNNEYKYHLDLRFATAKVTYIGVYADGSLANQETKALISKIYLAGHTIDEPEAGSMNLPDGYTADGYYLDHASAYSGDLQYEFAFGGSLAAGETKTVYIRLVKETKVTVTKQWTDENGNTITPSADQTVELTLYRADEDGNNRTAYRTLTLDGTVDSNNKDSKETAAWVAEFDHLPKRYRDADDDLHYYTYSVEETAVYAESGTRWKSTVSPSSFKPDETDATDTCRFTVTNKRVLVSLTIVKQDGTTDPVTKLTGAVFNLAGTNAVTGAEVSLTSAEGADGTYTITRIPDGIYTLTETTSPAGYTAVEALTVTVANGVVTVRGGDAEQYTWTAASGDNEALLTLNDPVDSKEITFLKTDMNLVETNVLSGAQFTLTGPDDLNVTLVSGDDGKLYKLTDGIAETEAYKLTAVSQAALTAEDKTVTTYTLTETKAPDGYILLSAPFEFYYDSAKKNIVVKAHPDDITSGTIQNMFAISGDTMVMTIPNSSGTELPATGGIGTTIFYIVGGVLVVGAGVVLIAKGRMRRRDDQSED